ncbi:MAG: hypothetical protein Ct9H90mP25_1330 [Gammaproteobacteria bacterium]|nr:MAG: hypothetical protein Ct9H90mP25_1330 [Gammaproteobacteria bacterium]
MDQLSLRWTLGYQIWPMQVCYVHRARGSLVSLDDSAAKSMPGVIDVVKIPATSVTNMLGEMRASEAVAVVADSYWTANSALQPSKLIGARPNTTLSQVSQSTSNLIGIFQHALIAPTTV